MTKIIRKLSYTSDSIVACVTGQCGQLCKKHLLVCSGGRKAVWKAKFLPRVCWPLSNPMLAAESPSEVNCPTTRGVSSWAILCAHLSAERLEAMQCWDQTSTYTICRTYDKNYKKTQLYIWQHSSLCDRTYCVFVDLFQIQCLQRSHHRKWIVQQQEVFHPGQFYVHIFQLNDSFNHRGICTANLDRTDVIGNESFSWKMCT
jgi:hypothetical protein